MKRTAETMDVTVNYEIKTEPKVAYLGKLADFGLGNPDGIPSRLADKNESEIIDYGERALEAIAPVTDFSHYSCIDGRNCQCNADKSQRHVRRRQVGGTGHLLEVAIVGGASVLDTINPNAPLDEQLDSIEDDYAKKTGVRPSAHMGGCGGVNGAIQDCRTGATDDAPVKVAKALMEYPDIYEASGLDYSDTLGEKVRENSAKAASFLQANNWDGQAYVDRTKQHEPAGVEELEVDETDHKFHGHKEDAILLVFSRDGKQSIDEYRLKELGLGEAFVVNLDASIDMAKAQAGNRGDDGAAQLLIANFAKHAEVAGRLASDKTPLLLLVI